MAALCFATLRDGTGDLQVMVDADRRRADAARLAPRFDLGDHLGVTGEVITTKHGELSVDAESLAITSKSLRPLPDKHKGLTDPEARVRPLCRPDRAPRGTRRRLASARPSCGASATRCTRRGFMEVETPILQQIHGGANARPFETHINAYDLDLYLRIATELHLKRLLVGGIEKVFEVGRQFRNEGADFKHNPEFTSLEVYETYGDYDTMRVLTQEIIQEAATAVYGAPRRPPTRRRRHGSSSYDLSGDWPVKTICQARLGGARRGGHHRHPRLRPAPARGADRPRPRPEASWDFLLEEIYGELCESTTTTPVFYTDFPKENAPLTRRAPRRPAAGREVGPGHLRRRAGHGVLAS